MLRNENWLFLSLPPFLCPEVTSACDQLHSCSVHFPLLFSISTCS